MLAEVMRALRCPVCHGVLASDRPASAEPAGATHAAGATHDAAALGAPAGLRCARGHSFNRARQGYFDLAAPGGAPRHPGDSAEMVAARAAFLAAGHYRFISAALADASSAALPSESSAALPSESSAALAGKPCGGRTDESSAGLVVDAGAGTGAHLAAVLDARPAAAGLALDTSRYALRRATRAHARAVAARADVWTGLPLADHSVSLLLNVFAPRNGAEFVRVLRADGTLLVVTPGPGHLAELVTALGLLRVDPDKDERLARSLDSWFTPVSSRLLRQPLRLRHGEVRAVVGMGPSAWHAAGADRAERIAALPDPVTVTAEVRLHRYSPAG